MKKKVLILTNPLDHEGGVVNYYNLFFKHFSSDDFHIEHFVIGSRTNLFYYPILKRILYPFYYALDLVRYILLLLLDRKIAIIQFSPSLIPVPLLRDGILIVVAKLLRKKIVVFYRGWKVPTYTKLKSNNFLRVVFNQVFQNKTQQIVLASTFKKSLIELNCHYSNRIIVTRTAIDKNNLVLKNNLPFNKIVNVLFLGRIQDLKGTGEIVEAVCLLHKAKKLDNFRFTIVGHEYITGYIEELKATLIKNGVSPEKVKFPGRLTGPEKFDIYSKNDVYLLPSYSEGCPNSVLEALASGLFCITTPVGALEDIIINGENGYLIKPGSAEAIVESLLRVNSTQIFRHERLEKAQKHADLFDIQNVVRLFNMTYQNLV